MALPERQSAEQSKLQTVEQFRLALEASASVFRSLVERIADGVLVLCSEGMIRFANPAAAELLGFPIDQLENLPFGRPVAPGETSEIDLLPQRGSGQIRTAELRSVGIIWEAAPAILVSLREITVRKQLEESLRFLAEASRVLSQSLDEQTILTTAAQLAIEFLGIAVRVDMPITRTESIADRLVDSKWRNVLRLDSRPDRQAAWQSRAASDFDYSSQTLSWIADALGSPQPLLRRAGDWGPDPECLACCLPLREAGRIFGVMTIFRVSGARFPEADGSLIENFVQRVAASLHNAELYRQSQELNQRRLEFLAMLGHELRNPLSAARHALELHRSEFPAASPPMSVQIAERQMQQMARLVDDLLEASRLTRGQIRLECQPTMLQPILEHAIQTSQSDWQSRQQSLDYSPPMEPIWVDADAGRLEQVFGNLLHNAAKFSDSGQSIRLVVHPRSDVVTVEVIDFGIGMSEVQLQQLFAGIGVEISATARERGGLGIGLTLAKQLTELHRGELHAWSAGLGQGSRFSVRLPRIAAPTQPVVPEVVANATVKPAMLPKVPRPVRVVLVEDHADGRKMLQSLVQIWGHTVESAGLARDGLTLIQRVRPDIALIDIGLPDFSGYELAKRIRQWEAEAGLGEARIELIAMTGYGVATEQALSQAAGFDRHWVKPIDLGQLEAVLANWPIEVG
ncbi:hybrid sensor histidine kinase/response regulator [Tuwongella immobilis]|uniref:histidine kinase n=1 Tax=Tuwongella immobilis TaxID=692036 RepID=A0A6C2YRT2_9BACT|nr:ATP-binding protein [Tuwongella immobilis]VIP04067.1 multi-sensor hybrid histidine kinase : Multi-sensor hybrid histidine kinase OS=Rhodopirellula maiorica SM1 GN=RMSM_01859 PE=4 SV=1: PAS_8: HisKA: HATPase_c: Response_reg [Tuwongella immobilis]VTS05501.1 multi-sensor hybrid histidine kinase : Multi-sensor hybrid histidine kinase OS=Rhodopirellula maiorica SM1 GN=RMSM_01859 PE=4 SV=1: PAS_8: HisKA: HATPase_c: Response_reg [Tuwongella immobilis]